MMELNETYFEGVPEHIKTLIIYYRARFISLIHHSSRTVYFKSTVHDIFCFKLWAISYVKTNQEAR